MVDYAVLRIPLATTTGTRVRIFEDGVPVSAVTIVELPAVAIGLVDIHFGQGQGIPLRQEALTWGRAPARTDGIFLTVPTGLSGTLIVVVGTDLTTES